MVYIIALVLTILIEIVVAAFLGYKKKSEIIVVILINLITNPLLNYILFINGRFQIIQNTMMLTLVLEIIIVLVEWILLMFALQQNSKKLFVLSLTMNFCSYMVGILFFR